MEHSHPSTPGNHTLILGQSAVLREQLSVLNEFAASEAPVYVYGETGTGKELVARAIHAASSRQAQRFIVQNCAALPDTLLQSLLFGHRRGTFTGADRDQIGVFEAAHGGTLLLDEVGEMSPPVQAALLRILQDGELTRLGDVTPKRIDVRVISATNRRLDYEVTAGRFRKDLYFRLSTLRIELPALRERHDDVRLLVSHFIADYNERSRKAIAGIDATALRTLETYAWPGNVRQLKGEIERACILTPPHGTIRRDSLSPEVRREATAKPVHDDIDALLNSGRSLPSILGDLERSLLEGAMVRASANKSEAARILGISRQRLSQRLEHWRLASRSETALRGVAQVVPDA